MYRSGSHVVAKVVEWNIEEGNGWLEKSVLLYEMKGNTWVSYSIVALKLFITWYSYEESDEAYIF
jgi:hypothetical protein